MAASFIELIHDLAAVTNTSRPERFHEGLRLHVAGVDFTVRDNSAEESGTLLYLCHIAVLPQGELREQMLSLLLEANLYLLGLETPRLAFDPERSEILIAGCLRVASVTPESLLAAFRKYADEARQWQRRFHGAPGGQARRTALAGHDLSGGERFTAPRHSGQIRNTSPERR